uniref:Uncharacterized protein n=1 Tax=Trachysalambria curvirostris nimavirus TaxID=2984282 RepID=A0A9C7C961_9VIRU|nr:MAG: hypothetical protein [Trachysalambria curvirostris nimavirus]
MGTHEDFKSICTDITSADDVSNKIGYALVHQYMFDRRTSPWEMGHFEDLEKFEIDLEKVDRLYFIHSYNDVSGSEFEILARMDYRDEKAYVHLIASCDFTGFDCQGGGCIYVSLSANVFTKVMLDSRHNPDAIYQMLREDGIAVEEQLEYDRLSRWRWSSAPMLKYLCHMAISKNKDTLRNVYKHCLPRILAESLDEFIRIQECKEAFDED